MSKATTVSTGQAAGNGTVANEQHAAESLCQVCALCCNGAIFADVRLQPGDSPKRLHELGLSVRICRRNGATAFEEASVSNATPIGQHKFGQPCAALEGCRCRIYAERPGYCREFECGVLKQFRQGKLERKTALRLIKAARNASELARSLLRELGDTDENRRVADRFRRTTRRLEAIGFTQSEAGTYGELTLVVHDLNFLLSEAFYPGKNIAACLERV